MSEVGLLVLVVVLNSFFTRIANLSISGISAVGRMMGIQTAASWSVSMGVRILCFHKNILESVNVFIVLYRVLYVVLIWVGTVFWYGEGRKLTSTLQSPHHATTHENPQGAHRDLEVGDRGVVIPRRRLEVVATSFF